MRDNGEAMERAMPDAPFHALCLETFPYVAIEARQGDLAGGISRRNFCGCSIIRTCGGPLAVRGYSAKAASAGLGDYLKIVWQRRGISRLHTNGRNFEIKKNEVFLVPIGESYSFDVDEDYDALMLMFNPKDHTEWNEIVRDYLGEPFLLDAPLQSAAMIANALLNGGLPNIREDMVLDNVIGLSLNAIIGSKARGVHPFLEGGRELLDRIRFHIERNMSDFRYSPAMLSKDMGMSRRSLYNAMSFHGLTPSAYMREIRLEHSRHDIMESPGNRINLTEVALKNGFSDGSSFSRSFKARYGMSPRQLLDKKNYC
jgi:AraC-like DNA-binding protein